MITGLILAKPKSKLIAKYIILNCRSDCLENWKMFQNSQKATKRFRIDRKVHCEAAHLSLSWRERELIKIPYNPCWLKLTVRHL